MYAQMAASPFKKGAGGFADSVQAALNALGIPTFCKSLI
jgi:hypothetical protein